VPAVVLLGVKPQKLAEIAPGLAPALEPGDDPRLDPRRNQLATLRALFPVPRTIVKAMPNLPVSLGKGVTELFTDGERRGRAPKSNA
jgi:pyrroline-5-carboxylate reductase